MTLVSKNVITADHAEAERIYNVIKQIEGVQNPQINGGIHGVPENPVESYNVNWQVNEDI